MSCFFKNQFILLSAMIEDDHFMALDVIVKNV